VRLENGGHLRFSGAPLNRGSASAISQNKLGAASNISPRRSRRQHAAREKEFMSFSPMIYGHYERLISKI
jgi:hypothetical protein